jgi:hypothetical protein
MVAMPPIETVGAIRARRVRAALRSTGWRFALALAAVVGIVLGVAIGHNVVAHIGLAIGFAVVLVAIVMIVIWVRASGSAEDDFMTSWGASHDLIFEESPGLGSGTPLLREGDEQKAENGLTGWLEGKPLLLCHYTYTVVTHSTNSNGGSTRQESDHPFTVVRISDLACAVSTMSLHPRNMLDRGWFDRADSALTKNRVVELESTDMHSHYKLEVRDDVPDLAVRQVFEPTFIVWCLDQKDVFFELEDGELVVAVKNHLSEQAPLDALLEQSRLVLERISAVPAPADRSAS